MKAVELTKYGAPEFLQMTEVEKPSPKENEILIKIHASAVSSGDARMRRADPFIIRFIFGFKRPRKPVLGVVVAGEVEALGKEVSNYKIGDQVFGSSGMKFGAHAEYVSVPEDAVLALKPGNMTYEEAASIPFGATASMHFLRIANIQVGQKVLIYGASGALGTMAVQLAKIYGAELTAVCSTANVDLMKSLGADHVIDYTQEDFTQNGEKYDVVFDTIGKIPLKKALKSLNEKGYLLLASAGIGTMIGGSVRSLFTKKKIVSGVIKETVKDMNFFKQLIEKGSLKAVIDRVYPLEQIAEAHAYVDKGHKKGNVIIAIN
ncbi:MAG: NAD(P)-dependent alcohol dehydrogenase [Candidatus Bathyarchaeota archaeon]|nr:NAD(P)-dependent alcohol dehydrogenase [Candidatus Bathyarchaeota archaeon]